MKEKNEYNQVSDSGDKFKSHYSNKTCVIWEVFNTRGGVIGKSDDFKFQDKLSG